MSKNIMDRIIKIIRTVSPEYDLSIADTFEIMNNSKSGIDMVSSGFYWGYICGKEATLKEKHI